ncbi:MAG TPA: hypothetical protein VEM36_01535 [Xanthobacteraceae bacterium]|nr:hypothetical protein [Xanthobacteraceae bacterium]
MDIPYRLPLVIGATGHRDLRDEDILELKRAVAGVIERLKRDYLGGDTETPIIVLSSLAEGADRLIAQVAMDHGAKLIAPLPMPSDEYRRDFVPGLKPDAAAEFDRLKNQAIAAPVMRFAADNLPENVHEESRRALQYREVGIYVIRHCHVLIALWNGDEEEAAVGGTTEVVRFRRDGIPFEVTGLARASLDAPEIGPVIYVDTPRVKPRGSATAVKTRPWGRELVKSHQGSWRRPTWRSVANFFASVAGKGRTEERPRLPDDERRELESWMAFEVQTELTRRFNREAARLGRSAKGRARLNTSLRDLFPEDEARNITKELLPRWCILYQIADTSAAKWQRWFRFDWQLLFTLGFLGIASFEVVTHLAFEWSRLFGVYAIVFICVLAWFTVALFRAHQEKFLDFRALAEALRVAVFWKIIGIGEPFGGSAGQRARVDLSSGDSVADAYPIRQPSELDWVKTCLRTLELLEVGAPSRVDFNVAVHGYAWARKFWVNGQLAFFSKRGPEHDRIAEARDKLSLVLLSLSTLVAVFLFFLIGNSGVDHHNWIHRVSIFLVGLLPGIAAVMVGYSERLALKAQARQYDRMRTLFERASRLLPEKVDPANFREMQALFAELGAEAMKEHAEWVAIYRQRPIRPP